AIGRVQLAIVEPMDRGRERRGRVRHLLEPAPALGHRDVGVEPELTDGVANVVLHQRSEHAALLWSLTRYESRRLTGYPHLVVKFVSVKVLASPRLALGFGIFLALAETCRRWGNWPF